MESQELQDSAPKLDFDSEINPSPSSSPLPPTNLTTNLKENYLDLGEIVEDTPVDVLVPN